MKHAMRYTIAYAATVIPPDGCGIMRVCSVASLIVFMTLAASASTVSFRPPKTYSVGSNPTAIAVGDFNGDGRPDLAALDSGGSTPTDQGGVSILFGKRDGTFQAAKNISVGKNCAGIAVGDFNGDGKDDLALVRPGDPSVGDNGDVTIFLGNGDGTFRQGTVLIAGENPNGSIAVADFNDDQKLDLVVVSMSTGDHSANVLLGNGDGSFQSPAAYVIGALIQHVGVGDFNRDRKQDLIGSPSPFVRFDGAIVLGNGDGTFQQTPSLAVPPFVALGDFNADGKLDVVAEHCDFISISPPAATCSYSLLLGNGDGTFQTGLPLSQTVIGAADLDGDGKLDIVGMITGSGGNEVEVAAGKGDGTFQSPVNFPATPGDLRLVADINADGAPDLVLLNFNNTIGVMLNTGTDFSITASSPSPPTLSSGESATANIQLHLQTNFRNPVSLSCNVQPAQAGSPNCSLSAKSVTFDASGNATATLTIGAGSSVAAVKHSSTQDLAFRMSLPVGAFVLFAAVFGPGASRKKRLPQRLLGLALFCGLISLSACGGSGGSNSVNYAVTVIATSGATKHSTSVNVTVH